MLIHNRYRKLIYSLLISLVIAVTCYIGFAQTGGTRGKGLSHRIFVLLGGDVAGGGYIQGLTFLAFFLSLFDILEKMKTIKYENQGFLQQFLPTDDKYILLPNDLVELRHRIAEFEKKHRYLLTDIIKKACTKFRPTKSISEIIEIISIQIEINKDKYEGHQSMIRYLIWLIPSVGFIGTVYGISQAMMIADSGDIELITITLGVAFDTTLVALVLSIIVMWLFHSLQEQTDILHANIKEYVIENLVNRIETD